MILRKSHDSYNTTKIGVAHQVSTYSPYTPPPLLAKEGNLPCEAGGAYSLPYQGGVGGG